MSGDGIQISNKEQLDLIEAYLEDLQIRTQSREYWTPTNAAGGVTLVSAVPVPTWGAWVFFLQPTADIAFTAYMLKEASGDGIYKVQLGIGLPGAEEIITEFDMWFQASTSNEFVWPRTPIICPKIAANERVSARVKDAAGTNTIRLFFGYVEYV